MARLRYLWRAHSYTFKLRGDRIVPERIPITSLGDARLAGALLVPNCLLVEEGGRGLVVDPGPFLLGNYLRDRLAQLGVELRALDALATHWHTDHTGALIRLRGRTLYLGAGERGAAHPGWWEWMTRGFRVVELEGETELLPGVLAVPTPGHTPGHISLVVETEGGRVLVAGDFIPTRDSWGDPRVRRRALKWRPDLIIPGHDREFTP